MRQPFLILVVSWFCFAEFACAQLLTVTTQFSAEAPLLVANGAASSPLIVGLTNAGADAALEDYLSAWQLSLAILPDTGAVGALTFNTASKPDANYLFPSGSNLGVTVINSGNELLAFDTNFPFSGGVDLPADLERNLLELSFLASSDAVGAFGLYALAGIGNSEWTDAMQPIQARRPFDNVPDNGGPVRIGDILVSQPGDFDFDNDVDGFDFLQWQRGESPNPFSASDLGAWEANFGTVAPLSAVTAASTAVPEPSTLIIVLCLAGPLLWRRRREPLWFLA